MAMLHTINKSPFERNALAACLRMAKPGASVLLIEDGVYAGLRNTKVTDKVSKAMQMLSFYALGADLKARGLGEDQVIDGIKLIDYDGFVELVVEHDGVQAWL
ncbi:MAG TPA: sulfurtransferase complex subunit TusB [Gammaproteobacteria bacterium]|jgi:tRNA 2-thiouridine synthesizing protein B|nr:sulfurtransferase complex subunit TusB [Gammaproteobacteria bacterium]